MAEQLLMIWDSEITRTGENTVTLTARRPLSRMSTKQAARLLGCTEWTVRKLYRKGLLSGWKPGAAAVRRDGRPSNACVVLDAGSVLEYKQSVSRRGLF
ncbi:MAG: hypothetical protein WCP45_13735 [Verrucomicrobiota bacterium]